MKEIDFSIKNSSLNKDKDSGNQIRLNSAIMPSDIKQDGLFKVFDGSNNI